MAAPGTALQPSARRRASCLWGLLSVAANAFADVDISDYQTSGSVRDRAQERALQHQFAREKQREAERQRAEQELISEQQMLAAALDAARPLPERLTRARCTKCHSAEHFARKRHSRFFWYLTVQRMVLLNEAELEPGEPAVITAYLTETYPADDFRAALELASPMVLPAAIWGLLKAVRLLGKKRRRGAAAGRP